MLRLSRLLRLVRVLRIFGLFKELQLLVLGLIQSLRSLFQVSIILAVLAYCFSIWFTVLAGQNEKHHTSSEIKIDRYMDGLEGQFW